MAITMIPVTVMMCRTAKRREVPEHRALAPKPASAPAGVLCRPCRGQNQRVLEMLGAVLLVVPAAAKWMPILTPLAAAVLALETLALAGLYARYSLQLAATNPMVWAVVMGVMAAFVAYGRYALRQMA
jgi:hypothetical protein